MRFEFGQFQLDDERYSLAGPSGPIHIEPQVFGVLHYLLVNRERVVTKEELLDTVWGSRFVSEAALTSRIKAARRAVDDDGQAQRVVKTIYGRGYQFVAEVRTQATRRPQTNLPGPLSTFVGRTEQVEALANHLAEYRLVTLTGPGGVGKTRLSLEIAHRVVTAYPGGVLFVDLAAVTEEAGVQRALAGALAVDDQPGQPLIDTLTTVLDHRPSTLLLLDNCEHVVQACARVAHTVLSLCSGVSLLATSRVPLGVEGECVRAVEPLDEGHAVALFVDRARLAAGELSMAAASRPRLEEICRQLDGLPLAIELAAGQLRVLEPDELAARLDDRFAVLQSRRATSERQRTLLATVQWSYELLTPSAQDAFDRLGIFPGSFTLEAAEAVASDARGSGSNFLTLLSELVDHSLVVRDVTGSTPARYRLLDTLRLFARQRLDARAAWDRGQHAHAEFLIGLAETAAPHFYAVDDAAWRKRLQAEDHNLRTVLDWAAEHEPSLAHRLAIALWFYWDVRWQERYATDFLQRLLDRRHPGVPDDLRAWALTAGADLAGKMGEGRISLTWAKEAAPIFERLGDTRGFAWARLVFGLSLANRGALDQANDVLTAALELAGELSDDRLQARALQWLGFLSARRGDLDLATTYHRQALDIWTRGDSIRGRAAALQWLAGIERDRRNLDAAAELCHRALACMEELDDVAGVAHVRLTLADVARLQGDDVRAATLYSEGLEEVFAIGDRRCIASTSRNLGVMANARNEHARAVELFLQALVTRHELGDEAGLAECLEGLAATAAALGLQRAAATVLAAAETRRDTSGASPHPEDDLEIRSLVGSLRQAMSPDDFERAWDAGRRLAPDAVVQFCADAFRTVSASP